MEVDILKIIQEEIRLMYPPNNKQSVLTESYDIHCSGYILDCIYKKFLDMGFLIPSVLGDLKKAELVKFQLPMLGILRVFPSLESGYSIRKTEIE